MFLLSSWRGAWGGGVWRSTKECVFDRGKPALSSKLLILFLYYTKYNVD